MEKVLKYAFVGIMLYLLFANFDRLGDIFGSFFGFFGHFLDHLTDAFR